MRRVSFVVPVVLLAGCAAPSIDELRARKADLVQRIEEERQVAKVAADTSGARQLDAAASLAQIAGDRMAASNADSLDRERVLSLLDRAAAYLETRVADDVEPDAAGMLTAQELEGRATLLQTRIDNERIVAKAAGDQERLRKLDAAEALLVAAKQRATRTNGQGQSVASADAADLLTRAEAALQDSRFKYIESPWFRLHAGAATLSPYVLARDTPSDRYRLRKGDTSPVFYTELGFFHREAWLNPDERMAQPKGAFRGLSPDDYEFRFRFLNREAQIQTSEQAAKGDWAFETAIGYSLYEHGLDQAREAGVATVQPRGAVNLEFIGSFETDRNGLQVRGSYGVGIGSVWSVPIELSDTLKRDANVYFGASFGIHEWPRVERDNVAYSTDERPHFNRLGTFGVKVDVFIPLAARIDAVIEGRLYTPIQRSDLPDDWSLFVGVTIPVGRWVQDLFKEE